MGHNRYTAPCHIPMSNLAATKPPTIARCTKVEATIKDEPAFASLLGAKTAELTRRDGVVMKFFPATVAVTAALDAAGKDANILPKGDIMAAAKAWFATQDGAPPSVTTTPTMAAPVAEVAAETEQPADQDSPPQTVPTNPRIGIYSCICSARQLAENDKKPGAASRRALIDAARDAYMAVVTN